MASVARSVRETLEKNALWVALGAVAVFGLVVAVGVQVAPQTFYDHYWWEDIWGPLVVDAHQCRSEVGCPGVTAPNGVHAVDGYTVKSELTYGVVLAAMLYGIYVGLFRRYQIRADGWFVLALMPWILLGPVGRALEDADVFCQAGTRCDPGPFAFVFISPVIYVAIALCVIAAMLIGVRVERHRYADPKKLLYAMAGIMGAGFLAFAALATLRAGWFTALPPLGVIGLACVAALWGFHWRATKGYATVNAVVFTLGAPFAVGTLWLVGRWLAGDVWSRAAWSGEFFRAPAALVLVMAVAIAAIVGLLARVLVARGLEQRWAALATRAPEKLDTRLGYAGGAAIVLALLMTGAVPALGAFANIANRETLVPILATLGGLALLAGALVHVGRGVHARPGLLLAYAAGINLAMLVGHSIDGLATWMALDDPFGFGIPQYSEKHPFSEVLLRYWGGFMFPFAKILLVLIVVWVLDRDIKQDRPDEANMVGLVKMAIFVLGFAPGLRDTLRLAMGV